MLPDARQTTAWLTEILEAHERRLVLYAARITGDIDLARDVVQETFLKLIRKDRQELDGKLPQWLYTVCRHQAIDVKRKEGRMQTSAEVESLARSRCSTDPLVAVERSERTTQAQALVAALPDKQQEAIRLRFTHGLSYKQIADVMETTVNNVGVLIHTAVKSLRGKLGGEATKGRRDEGTKLIRALSASAGSTDARDPGIAFVGCILMHHCRRDQGIKESRM